MAASAPLGPAVDKTPLAAIYFSPTARRTIHMNNRSGSSFRSNKMPPRIDWVAKSFRAIRGGPINAFCDDVRPRGIQAR